MGKNTLHKAAVTAAFFAILLLAVPMEASAASEYNLIPNAAVRVKKVILLKLPNCADKVIIGKSGSICFFVKDKSHVKYDLSGGGDRYTATPVGNALVVLDKSVKGKIVIICEVYSEKSWKDVKRQPGSVIKPISAYLDSAAQ